MNARASFTDTLTDPHAAIEDVGASIFGTATYTVSSEYIDGPEYFGTEWTAHLVHMWSDGRRYPRAHLVRKFSEAHVEGIERAFGEHLAECGV